MVSVFDRLVREISSDERRRLLDKLSHSANLSEEPLRRHDAGSEEPVLLEKEFAELGFFAQLRIIILGFFTGRGRKRITEEYLLVRLRRKVERVCPGWVDFQRGVVKPRMYKEISRLAAALDVFRKPLLHSVEAGKTDFYGLLGRLEFEEIHARLDEETQLKEISGSMPDASSVEIKRLMHAKFDSIIVSLTSDDRRRMKQHAETLVRLKNLVRYPCRRFLDMFPPGEKGAGGAADLRAVNTLLLELGNALWAFRQPPRSNLLKALFLFELSGVVEDQPDMLETELANRMDTAGEALDMIRKINKEVPWPQFLKAVAGDIHYAPSFANTGDDWFRYYKEFWNRRMSWRYKNWANGRRLLELQKGLALLWGVDVIPGIPGYRGKDFPQGLLPGHEKSLAALNTLFLDVFPGRLYHSLNLIMMDGKFYKKDNRRDYNEIFERFMRMPDKLRAFSYQLRPEGEIGSRFSELRRLGGSESLHAMEGLILAVDRDSRSLIIPVIGDLQKLSNLIQGILEGDGGTYDTLSNMMDIGGQSNETFRRNLQNVWTIVEKSGELMKELISVEEKCALKENAG